MADLTDTYLLSLVFSLLIGMFITFAIVLGIKEWQLEALDCNLKRQKMISLSTIVPNFLMYMITAPYWHVIYQSVGQYAIFDIDGVLFAMPLALIACDLSYYWEHRIAHKLPLLWKLYHGTHHTAISYNIPLAYRVNALNMLIAPWFYMPWILLGLEPLMVLGFQLFVFHYQGWIHTNLIGEIKGFDKWFNSPANHRMHHSRDDRHQNVNFSAVFMVWDRIFGTYMSPESNVKYGLSGRDADDDYQGIYKGF